ncbi:MAG: hypothetical protein LBS84_05950 [Clostridiales bacterium]|nr:hypothetical protein [Clostridiales bacterium]
MTGARVVQIMYKAGGLPILPLTAVWLAGVGLMALFYCAAYFKCRGEFAASRCQSKTCS